MIDAAARSAWYELDASLRPFVARRVGAEADVDDVIQEIYLRMQKGLAGLRDDQRFGPWVYQLARNTIADHYRAAARSPLSGADGGTPLDFERLMGEEVNDAGGFAKGDAGGADRELARYVAPFVAMLPSPYREALTLTELEGLSQREAAEMMGITLSGMKSRVQRGREKLRTALEDCCHIAVDARGKVVDFSPRPDGKLPGNCCG